MNTLSKCSKTRNNFFSATTTSRSLTTAGWLSSFKTEISLRITKLTKVDKNRVGLTWLLWRAPLHFPFPNGFASTPRSALSLYPSPKRWCWHDPGPKVQYTPCTRRHTFPRQVSPVLCNCPYLSEIRNFLSIGGNILPLNIGWLKVVQFAGNIWIMTNFWKLLAKLYKQGGFF